MTKVGILGLGMMGSGIASNLLSKKFEVHVYNRTGEKMSSMVEKGAIGHSTPEELGRNVDIAITMVTDHIAVEEIVFGKRGLLGGMKKDALWIDMSTIDPETSVHHAKECEEYGVKRLDAPVMGGPKLASEGALVLLVGGRLEVYEAYREFLLNIGKDVVYLGSHGSGHRMKLALNLYLALKNVAFAEALTFALKQGFQGRTFVETLNKTHMKSGFTQTKGVSVAQGHFTPTFTLQMMLKDLILADRQALLHKMSLPMTGIARQLYISAQTQGLADLDYSSIALLIQRLNAINSEKILRKS